MKQFRIAEPMKDPKDYLEIQDVSRMYNNASTLRDKALIYTLFFSARRISEVLAITINDILFDTNEINFTILKKRSPTKVVLPVHKNLIEVLTKYTRENLYFRKKAFLFPGNQGYFKPLHRSRVHRILNEYGRNLDIHTKGGRLPHAHAFRHSFSLWAGSKVKTVEQITMLQTMLQHSSIELTAYYIRRTRGELRKFWDGMDLPF